jgi:ATP-binding cassette subfamily B protein
MKEKQKKKSGVSRLFEIAGEKKGLLMLAGVLSAVSALCMLVPYWSVYEVLKELLLHGSKISELDSSVLIHWGWVAFVGLVAGLLLLYGALMASHVAERFLYLFNDLWTTLSRLEYIGKHKENIVVAERSRQPKESSESRWNILD